MEKLSKLLVTVVVLSLLIAGITALLLVMEVVSTEEAKVALIKTMQVFGIITLVSGGIIAVLQINKR